MTWVTNNLQHGLVVFIAWMVVVVLASWWAQQWWVPPAAIFVAFAIIKTMAMYRKNEQVLVIETNLAGEVIQLNHCQYFRKEIAVTATQVRAWGLPRSRFDDCKWYGDKTPALPMRNIMMVDYIEERPNGDIVVVFPQNHDFGNANLLIRANDEIAQAMAVIGEKRAATTEFRGLVVDMFHEGRFGDPNSREAQLKLRSQLTDTNVVRTKLGNMAAATRNFFLFYKNRIPENQKQLLMLQQDVFRLASVEVSKWLHVLYDHPMKESTATILEQMLQGPESYDYEEKVRRLVKKGKAAARGSESEDGVDSDAVVSVRA